MRTFPLTKEVNLAQLGQEIADAAGLQGLIPLSASWDGSQGVLTVHRDDIDPALVQQLLDAHVPEASPAEAVEERLRQLPDAAFSGPFGTIVLDILRYLGLRE